MHMWLRVHRALIMQYFREAAVCSSLWCAGDAAAQLLQQHRARDTNSGTESPRSFNPWRTLRTAGIAVLVVAPMSMRWYIALERVFPDPKALLQRVSTEHLIWSPMLLFFYFIATSVGQSSSFFDTFFSQLRYAYLSSLVASWAILLPAEALNYWVLPTSTWTAVQSVSVVVWTAWVSHCSDDAARIRTAKEEWSERQKVSHGNIKEYVRELYGTEKKSVKLMR